MFWVLVLTFAWSSAFVECLTDSEISAFVAKTHIEQNSGVQGTVSVTVSQADPDVLELKSNGIPDHVTGDFGPSSSSPNPNDISAQSNSWKIPKNPTAAPTTTCLPQGPIAMAINGVAMYNPYSITCCDTGVEEIDLFDSCMGHPAPGNVYHYHLNPTCLYTNVCNQSSSIIGVAFDGFPIYGPNDEDGTPLTTTDLDECNGKVTNGNYRYHITVQFPYIMGCYKGTVRADAGINVGGTCTCTSVTTPCTEFGGRRRRKRQTTTATTFECSAGLRVMVPTGSSSFVTTLIAVVPAIFGQKYFDF